MASSAPTGDGADDKLPDTAPRDFTSLDPPADLQRNVQFPEPALAPSSGDDDKSVLGMLELPNTLTALDPDDFTSPDPPADPQRNDEFPATLPPPSPGDDDEWDKSVLRMLELPDRRPRPRCGMERLLVVVVPTRGCPACEVRKKDLLDNREGPRRIASPANRRSDGEFSPLPFHDGKPVLGLGTELPDPRSVGRKRRIPTRARGCPEGELFKKVMPRNQGEELGRFHTPASRRNVASPPAPVPSSGDGKLVLGMELPDPRALSGMKRPPTAQIRGCCRCEGFKKMMLDKEGLCRFYAPVNPRNVASPPAPVPSSGDGKSVPGIELPDPRALSEMKQLPTAQTRGCCRCKACKKMIVEQEVVRQEYEKLALEVAGFAAKAGGGALHEKMTLDDWKVLVMLALLQGVQYPSSSSMAGRAGLHTKMILYEQGVILDSREFMRLQRAQVVSRSAVAEGGLLGGSHGGLDHDAMYKVVKRTGESMQETAETVIPQLFSKEILYEPVLQCVGCYPKWLEENKNKVKKEEYEQYQKQLDLMVNLTLVYDDDPDNFSKIVKIVCKIVKCGRPPSEIIADICPGLDPNTVGQLYPGILELLNNVMDKVFSAHTNPSPK